MATHTPESPRSQASRVSPEAIHEVLTLKCQVQSRKARPQSGLGDAEGLGPASYQTAAGPFSPEGQAARDAEPPHGHGGERPWCRNDTRTTMEWLPESEARERVRGQAGSLQASARRQLQGLGEEGGAPLKEPGGRGGKTGHSSQRSEGRAGQTCS